MIIQDLIILILREQVVHIGTDGIVALSILLAGHSTRLDDDVALVVDDGIKFLGGQTEQIAYLVRQAAEVPDMSHWHHQLYVSCTLTAHLLLSDLHTATVADDTLVTDALVLAAGTLIILGRTKDALAEQTVALRLVGTVVDGLGFGHLAEGVLQNLFR